MWLDLVRDFQSLIVGAGGFLGVIFTLRHNARLARDQREDERRYERDALRSALIAELEIVKDSFETNLNQQYAEVESGLVPTDPLDNAYRALMPRIGLLAEGEVSKAMAAYLTLQTYNGNLFLIGTPAPNNPRHVLVGPTQVPRLQGMTRGTLKKVDEALAALREARDRRGR